MQGKGVIPADNLQITRGRFRIHKVFRMHLQPVGNMALLDHPRMVGDA